jgi:hypothetical protein
MCPRPVHMIELYKLTTSHASSAAALHYWRSSGAAALHVLKFTLQQIACSIPVRDTQGRACQKAETAIAEQCARSYTFSLPSQRS